MLEMALTLCCATKSHHGSELQFILALYNLAQRPQHRHVPTSGPSHYWPPPRQGTARVQVSATRQAITELLASVGRTVGVRACLDQTRLCKGLNPSRALLCSQSFS